MKSVMLRDWGQFTQLQMLIKRLADVQTGGHTNMDSVKDTAETLMS